MDLVFGGAYQGKLDYVKGVYNIKDEDVFYCSEDFAKMDFSKKVIYGMEKFSLACVKKGNEVEQVLGFMLNFMKDKVVICDDISQGIVPISDVERLWREENGRMLVRLAKEADNVTRIFCGLPLVLKEDEKMINYQGSIL